MYGVLIGIPLILFSFALLPKKHLANPELAEREKQTKVNKKSKVAKKKDISSVVRKQLATKTTKQLTQQKGVEKWGKYFIDKKQFTFLAEKIEVGHHLKNVKINLRKLKVLYKKENSPQLEIYGALRAPQLPRGLSLNIRIQLCCPVKKNFYAQSRLIVDEDNSFKKSLGIRKEFSSKCIPSQALSCS